MSEYQPNGSVSLNPVRSFGAFPWLTLALMIGAVVLSTQMYAYSVSEITSVRCGDEVMTPYDVCEATDTQTGETTEYSYQNRLEGARSSREQTGQLAAFPPAAAGWFLVASLWVWFRDRPLRRQMKADVSGLRMVDVQTHHRWQKASFTVPVLGWFATLAAINEHPEWTVFGVCAALTVAAMVVTRPRRGSIVQYFDGGVRAVVGGQVVVVPWSEARIGATSAVLRDHFIEIAGQRCALPPAAADWAVKQLELHQVPMAMAAVGSGAVVDFGAVSANYRGLVYANSLLSWDDIAEVKPLQQQVLFVSPHGQTLFGCEMGELHNFIVLRRVVQQFATARGQGLGGAVQNTPPPPHSPH